MIISFQKALRNLRREYFRYSVKNTSRARGAAQGRFVCSDDRAGVRRAVLWAEAGERHPGYETIFLRKERYTSIEVL